MTIALIGYGINPPTVHLALAKELGLALGERKHTLLCGGYQGTLEAGLAACLAKGGKADVALEESRVSEATHSSFRITSVTTTKEKHALIAKNTDAAIAIGGGPGSLKLANTILQKGKPLFIWEDLTESYNTLMEEPGVFPVSDFTTLFQQLERLSH